jgi:hypothetical protein
MPDGPVFADFNLVDLARGAAALQPAVSAGRFVTAAPLFVDISAQPVKTNLVRKGFQVPAVEVDKTIRDSFIDRWVPVPPKKSPRVVTQSIPPGTQVAPGTVVNLVMAPPSIIPLDIFTGIHADFKGRTVEQASLILDNPAVQKIALQYKSADEVPETDRQVLVTALAQADVEVDDQQPEKSFGRAFSSLRNTAAFR